MHCSPVSSKKPNNFINILTHVDGHSDFAIFDALYKFMQISGYFTAFSFLILVMFFKREICIYLVPILIAGYLKMLCSYQVL